MVYPQHGPEFHYRLGWMAPCRAATTANITISTGLNSGDTIDGVTLATGDRVLVKDQSTGSQNGIYVVSASPARAGDYAESGDIVGSVVMVSEGTVNADTAWKCTTNAAITVDTTALVFAAFGNALAPAGYTISNDTTDRTLDANSVTLDELADIVATLIRDLGGD